jgi:oligopeptide/dipeptide ABC transporter ATP-binding protein
MEHCIDVRNLRISFRTNDGTVKAVRDISFCVNKGETLAVVGESGSGKSVTARAVLGILAPNAIVDSGEIIYDGVDLLKLSEKDFKDYRGNRISMIFQDPMSSLNPIMKIGKQLTEAMILNGRSRQNTARKDFNAYLRALKNECISAGCDAKKVMEMSEALLRQAKRQSERINAENRDAVLYFCAPLNDSEYNDFVSEFCVAAITGIKSSAKKSKEAKQNAVIELKKILPVFEKEKLDRNECRAALKIAAKSVIATIDKLVTYKENLAYTFEGTLNGEMDRYFFGIKNNPKEEKRYLRDKEKSDRALKKGRDCGSAVPPVIIDIKLAQDTMVKTIKNIISAYEKDAAKIDNRDYGKIAADTCNYLVGQYCSSNYRVTVEMAKRHAIDLMEEVGIENAAKRYESYPFEFSGGMRQRIVIAIALAANPEILICDEPTTALDVTIQAQILELINKIKKERNLSVIFITHNLGVVANMADRIAVMYAGKIVEIGSADDIFYSPAHPYTWALLSSMPDLDTKEKLEAIPGTPPNMIMPPLGDAFAARNKYAMQIDFEKQPPMFKISDTHFAATWLLHPDAPKVEPPRAVTERIERMKKKLSENGEIKAADGQKGNYE